MRSIALALLAVLAVIPALPVPAAADCADITKVLARVATDLTTARWLLRLPASASWNGRLVVGVPGGFRSEFMGDYIFSDLVVQQGFAYVSTNKGMLNFFFTATGAATSCAGCSPSSLLVE